MHIVNDKINMIKNIVKKQIIVDCNFFFLLKVRGRQKLYIFLTFYLPKDLNPLGGLSIVNLFFSLIT